MFSSAILSLVLASPALANVFITSPVSGSSFAAGQPANITWMDDGKTPSLSQFGNATFAVFTGNAIQQTILQTIATGVDVSTTSSIPFTPDATIGPNSGEYFIRVTSASAMSPSAPQYPAEAFSSLFTLSGMSGTFNSSIEAEINGQSTAPIGGSTSAPAATVAPTTAGISSSNLPTSASASPTTSATTKSTNSAGRPVVATGFVALAAALIGASLL